MLMKKLFILLVVLVCAVAVFWWRHDVGRPGGKEDKEFLHHQIGVNIGHWLSDEFAAHPGPADCREPAAFDILHHRFGTSEADRLLDVYREHFITSNDVAAIKAMGFYAVRIPVNAALLFDYPVASGRFERVAQRLDWLLEQAAANDLMVVINLSARPGQWAAPLPLEVKRYSPEWSPRDVEEVGRLWTKLASRFREAKALAGYDLSAGSCGSEKITDGVYLSWVKAIQSEDASHPVYAPWRKSAVAELDADPALNVRLVGFAAEAGGSGGGAVDPIREVTAMYQFWNQHGRSATVVSLGRSGDSDLNATMSSAMAINHDTGWPVFVWNYKGPLGGNARVVAGSGVESGFLMQAGSEEIEALASSMLSIDTRLEQDAVLSAVATISSKRSGEEVADRVAGAVPEGWEVAAVGTAEFAGGMDSTGEWIVRSSGVGPAHHVSGYTWIYREAGDGVDIHARFRFLDAKSDRAGAGLIIKERNHESAPFAVVYRTGSDTVRAHISAHADRPAMMRTLNIPAGAEYLRIIIEGPVMKASCSTDGITWPVAENFMIPWITNQVSVGYIVFSGHEYVNASVAIQPTPLQASPR